jgi:hypothetical protein
MTDIPPPPMGPPPGTPPPPVPPSYPPSGVPPAGAPPPGRGMSTGVKIAIGCGAALLLVLILMFACFGLAGRFVSHKARDFSSAMEDQQKAQEKVEELEREHPFTPPADGTLDEGQVEKFFAVTDDAWDKMKDWIHDMQERGERIEARKGEAGFRDAVAGMQGLGRARVAIAEALDDHDMAPGAYVWTGFRLIQAHDAQASGSPSGVPEKNLEIARKYSDRVAELKEENGKKEGKAAVLGLAFTLFPRADLMMPAGMDTLVPGAR